MRLMLISYGDAGMEAINNSVWPNLANKLRPEMVVRRWAYASIAIRLCGRLPTCPPRWPSAKVAIRQHRNRASAQTGFISQLRRGQHSGLRPFLPPCSSLRIAFVKRSCRSITGWRLQWVVALRRVGSALAARVVQQKRHDVESVASAGANPAASTIFHGAEATVDRHRPFNPVW